MKPSKGSHLLRKGRISIRGQYYVLTTVVLERKAVFIRSGAAEAVLSSLNWLERKEIIKAIRLKRLIIFWIDVVRSGSLNIMTMLYEKKRC